jgi:hypothetical protein
MTQKLNPISLERGQIIRYHGTLAMVKDVFRSETTTEIVLHISTTARTILNPYQRDFILLDEFEQSLIKPAALKDLHQEIWEYQNLLPTDLSVQYPEE